MRFFSYLNFAITILQSYNGSEPFHLFIKKFFATHKKFGSKDRKQITSLCYNYFRLGPPDNNISAEDRILLGTFLCENKSSEFLQSIKPEWNELIESSLEEKLVLSNAQLTIENLFPFNDEFSDGIAVQNLKLSFLIQPKLFLRIRPGNKNKVAGKLAGANIVYELISESCIALPNASKVDTIIELDKDAVVQDYNSQRVGEFFKLQTANYKLQTKVWDCCAGSGGKSIMAFDILKNIDLTVSDKRESILQNLQKRFARAEVKNYKSFIADLTKKNLQLSTEKFDLIICDVPCTGSGTWGRTPEQLFYFEKDAIDEYAALQKKIIENAVIELKPGGHLLYVTCSVFKKENEEVVEYIKEKFKFKLQRKEILKGYEIKADTLFAAMFTAPQV